MAITVDPMKSICFFVKNHHFPHGAHRWFANVRKASSLVEIDEDHAGQSRGVPWEKTGDLW